jgi:hypothetical protein
MVTITVRKAINQGKHQRRGKRGGGRVLVEADWIGMSLELDDAGLEWLAGQESPPEIGAMPDEEYRRLFGLLTDDALRRIARLRMEGHSDSE